MEGTIMLEKLHIPAALYVNEAFRYLPVKTTFAGS